MNIKAAAAFFLTLTPVGALAASEPPVAKLDQKTQLSAASSPRNHGLPTGPERSIDEFIGQFVDLAMFDGAVLVDIGGTVVYDKRFGLAQYELGVAHGPDTRFRIASVSKMLTKAAVGVMVQKGVLGRETQLSLYLPDFPSAEVITIGHLLDNTSGIPHTNAQPWGDGKISLSLDGIVERLARLPLDFPPGTDRSYSNGGYAVLAKVLEVAGGKTFPEVMRETVFDPLGMSDTDHIVNALETIPGIATGYEPGPYPGERWHSRFYAVETRPGGGSFYSTTGDLLEFKRAVFREGFLEPRIMREVLGDDGEPYSAQGRSPGFVAKALFEPARDIIVISLSNNYAVPADWAEAIADLATGKDLDGWPEIVPVSAKVEPEDARIGRYLNSFSEDLQTIHRSERAVLVLTDEGSNAGTGLVPLADGAFLMPLYFQRCDQALATRLITCRMLSGDPRYTSELAPVSR